MSETQDTLENSELIPYESLFASTYTVGSVIRGAVLTGITMGGFVARDANPFNNERSKSEYYLGISDESMNEFMSFRRSFQDLDSKYRVDVVNKIKNSGLLNLIENVGGIREFARKRFSSDEALRRICCRY